MLADHVHDVRMVSVPRSGHQQSHFLMLSLFKCLHKQGNSLCIT